MTKMHSLFFLSDNTTINNEHLIDTFFHDSGMTFSPKRNSYRNEVRLPSHDRVDRLNLRRFTCAVFARDQKQRWREFRTNMLL